MWVPRGSFYRFGVNKWGIWVSLLHLSCVYTNWTWKYLWKVTFYLFSMYFAERNHSLLEGAGTKECVPSSDNLISDVTWTPKYGHPNKLDPKFIDWPAYICRVPNAKHFVHKVIKYSENMMFHSHAESTFHLYSNKLWMMEI